MSNLDIMLNQKTWDAEHSSVWKEIVSRFGQADYDDLSKRAKHQETLKGEYDAQQYSRKRKADYPSIEECVHAILDDQLDALQAKRAEIKTKYPKGD
tara:strand:- start:46 stop:336 length:291 start_codon:yes stop_codon:yes gene_type:complete